MQSSFIIEAIGYLGSLIVLVSFLMTSVFKLRVVNTVGSFIFMVYALIIRSYPTALMNLCLVIINLRFLWKISRSSKEYELVRVGKDDSFLRYFLDKYGQDIKECFPGLKTDPGDADIAYIENCQNIPVGVFLGKGTKEDMEILLDYSIPEYRDFSLGKFLMEELKKDGVGRVRYLGPDDRHME